MDSMLILAFLFFIGCLAGWCIEVVYRRFNKSNLSRKWVNPGFLTGPWIPLYGFGLASLYLMTGLEETAVFRAVGEGSRILLFLLMSLVMTLLEYIAGLIFIRGMKIRLWDYSNERFNLQGIICLRFSIYWAILGAVYYFLIHPYILDVLLWFSQNLTFSFVVGMFYGVFLVDLTYSLNIVAKVRRFAVKNQLLVRYEELREQIQIHAEERREKTSFLFRFRSEVPLREHLDRYYDLHRAFGLGARDMLDELKEELQERNAEIRDTAREIAAEKIEERITSRQEELSEYSRTGRQK